MADNLGVNPVPANNDTSFPNQALELVKAKIEKILEKTDEKPQFGVYVVWFAFIMGNWKALVPSTLPDGRYYEVTHGPRGTFIDTYVKVDNEAVEEITEPIDFTPDVEIVVCENHRPVIHADGMPAWCNACKKDADGRTPVSIFKNQ